MRKSVILPVVVILLTINTSCGLFKPSGLYVNNTFRELLLKDDSTFYFNISRGMLYVYSAGTWTDEKNKIRFQSDDSCAAYRYEEAIDSTDNRLKINYFDPNDPYPYKFHIPVIFVKDGKDTIVDSKYGENYFSGEFLDFDTIFFKNRHSDLVYTRLNPESNVINVNTEPVLFTEYWRNTTMRKLFPMRLEWIYIKKDNQYNEINRYRYVFKKKFREPRTRFVKKHYE